MDLKIHKGDPLLPRYTVFSLWDTYRAAHPLYQLVYPDFNRKFVMTFLGQYKENKDCLFGSLQEMKPIV